MRFRSKRTATALLGLCLTAIGFVSCDDSKPWGSGKGFGIDGVRGFQPQQKTEDTAKYSRGGAGSGDESSEKPRDRQVTQILRTWAGCSRAERNMIVAEFRANPKLHAALIRIIELESRYLVPAIEIAGRLGLQSAIQYLHLIVLNGKPKPKAAAIIAIDRMERWSNKRLAEFLVSLDEDVILAALAVCKDRSEPPVGPMIQLLGDSRQQVRVAAYHAMPEQCNDADAQRELLALAESDTTPVAIVALQAIGDFADFPGRESCLAKMAGDKKLTVRLAAQGALANLGRQMSRAAREAIHRRLEAPKAGILEKLECLMALERTKSIDAHWLFQASTGFHPTVRMHVARCLLLAGHPGGIEILIEGLSAKQSRQVSDEDVDYILAGSRAILTELLGRDVGEKPTAWRQHMAALRRARPSRIRFQPWKVH